MQVHLVKKKCRLLKQGNFFHCFKNTQQWVFSRLHLEWMFFLSARDKIPFAFKMTRGHFGQWCFDIPVCVAPNTIGCVWFTLFFLLIIFNSCFSYKGWMETCYLITFRHSGLLRLQECSLLARHKMSIFGLKRQMLPGENKNKEIECLSTRWHGRRKNAAFFSILWHFVWECTDRAPLSW